MSVSILRNDNLSRHERPSRRHLLRKVTRYTHFALRALSRDSVAAKDASYPGTSTAGLLALYGLPFPIIINP